MAARSTVRDYVTLQRGLTYKGSLVGQPGPALLGLGSIRPGGGFREGDYKTYGGECPSKLMLFPGDLFVSLKGATKDGEMIGSVARVPSSVATGRLTQDTVGLKFQKQDQQLVSFLYWVLRTPQYRDYCAGRATGSAVVALSRDDFLNFPIPEPTKGLQRLVQIFDTIETKIELNRRMNETLEGMARALFKSWFVDFDPVRAKLDRRPPPGLAPTIAAIFPDHFHDSGIGKLPNGWRVLPLAEAMDSIIDYRGKTPNKTSSGVPLVTAKIVKNGRIEEFGEFISADDYDSWMRRGMPHMGDIVMTTEAPLGEIAQLDDRKVALAQRLITLRGKAGVLDNTYLRFLMQSPDFQNELQARASGTTVVGIRQSELRRISLPVPLIELQRAFTDIVVPMTSRIDRNWRENENLARIRDALLPKLLSGEIRIPAAEKLVEEVA